MKKLFCLILVVVLCLSFAACAASMEDVAGEWAVYDDGTGYSVTLALNEEGNFAWCTYTKEGMDDMRIEKGTYTLEDDVLTLSPLGGGEPMVYTYKNDKLVSEGHTLTRAVNGMATS